MDMENYYNLKQKYQSRIIARQQKIKSNQELTTKEKRAEYKKIKPKCINCERPGGTLFEEKNGMLKAVCTSKTPCNLNINIKRIRYDNMSVNETENDKTMENLKMRIIMTKLDYLFGLNTSKDDTIDKFNKLKEQLSDVTEKQLILNKNYGDILSGINRDPLLNDYNTELAVEIDELKKIYAEYALNPDQPAYLTDMIERYLTKILPLTENIRKIKYGYYVLEEERLVESLDTGYNYENIIYTLVANPYLFEQMEQEQK